MTIPSGEKPMGPPCSRNDSNMFQIFQNVQFNVVQHKKYIKEMKKIYKKLNEDKFKDSFANAILYLFTFGDTSANVDRVIQFVANFCASLDDEGEFLLFIFEIIFKSQCVSGQSVRYRASQLLAACLAALGEDASLDDELCDKLLESQLLRLQDTRGAVRCRAALALQRLQNPMEPNDDVTRAYRFHMSSDPSSSVRRAIVMSIAKCSRNVPFVMERLCDVDEAVRRAAFLYISAMSVTQLRIRQRVHILKVGLTERRPRVRRVVEEILIPGWLSTFKGNIIDLLTAVRLDNIQGAKDSQYVAGKLLESLFRRLPVSELLEWLPVDKTLRLIPADKLNKETAWYWRHLAESLLDKDDEETLEMVLPDLVVLTGYIRAIVESKCPEESSDPVGFSTRQYVLHEMARLLRVYDAGDEVGRSATQKLISDVLTGDYGPMNPEVLRAFVSALELVVPDVTARVELVGSVISELREPNEPEPQAEPVLVENTEIKVQRARLRVSLNEAVEAQEEAVREQNYALAEECKARVERIHRKLDELNSLITPAPPPPVTTLREKKCDAEVLNKCLIILNSTLDSPHITTISPLLKIIFSELEVEIFQNPDIVENALETVALYGMLDKEFAMENKAFFFSQFIDTSNETLTCTVLRCILDLMCVHGARLFEEEETLLTNNTNMSASDCRRSKKKKYIGNSSGFDGGDPSISLSPGHGNVIELLLTYMDRESSAYRVPIIEGLCRLLTLGHLESPSILSKLLILWYNPATAEEDMLRQIIGVFFSSFVMLVEGAQEQILNATLPTLRALANAPSSSPIAEIDQESVVRFIVSLTRVNYETVDSQGQMALMLCSRIKEAPDAAEAGLVCRALALLAPPRSLPVANSLAQTLRDLPQKNLLDKNCWRNLTKYLGALEAFERQSMTKASIDMGTTGDFTGISEDGTTRASRATTSLPQHPLARSTHVVVRETLVEEDEVEIDEASPPDNTVNNDNTQDKQISNDNTNDKRTSDDNITNEKKSKNNTKKKRSADKTRQKRTSNDKILNEKDLNDDNTQNKRTSNDDNDNTRNKRISGDDTLNERDLNDDNTQNKRGSDGDNTQNKRGSDNSGNKRVSRETERVERSDSDVSPVKKSRTTKKGKKKQVRSSNDSETAKDSKQTANTWSAGSSDSNQDRPGKRSRDQQSDDEGDRAQQKSPRYETNRTLFADLDTSNITIRRSTRSYQGSPQTTTKTKQKVILASSSESSPEPQTTESYRKYTSFADLDTSNVTVRRSTKTFHGSNNNSPQKSTKTNQKTVSSSPENSSDSNKKSKSTKTSKKTTTSSSSEDSPDMISTKTSKTTKKPKKSIGLLLKSFSDSSPEVPKKKMPSTAKNITPKSSSSSSDSENSPKTTKTAKKTTNKSRKPAETKQKATAKGSKTTEKGQKLGKKGPEVAKRGKKAAETLVSESDSGPEFFESDDETELHTVVYEKEMEHSILQESSIDESYKSNKSIVIPATPDSSERSESDEESPRPKAKRMREKK